MPARSVFLSIRVLEVLAELPPHETLSEREIIRRLVMRDPRGTLVETWMWDGNREMPRLFEVPPPRFEFVLDLCLRDLAHAELIVGEDLKEGGKRWRMVPRWPGRDGGGGDDGREPPSIREGGGDGGGGGIGEVLAHPRLFALSEQDFESMLNHVTGMQR